LDTAEDKNRIRFPRSDIDSISCTGTSNWTI